MREPVDRRGKLPVAVQVQEFTAATQPKFSAISALESTEIL
jgi:hypothetical protein